MLIVRAPVRISFAGGGTDLPAYYERHGGLVISTSIDKYFYVIIRANDPETVQVSSSDYRMFFRQRSSEQRESHTGDSRGRCQNGNAHRGEVSSRPAIGPGYEVPW